jgi:hypothetical protein
VRVSCLLSDVFGVVAVSDNLIAESDCDMETTVENTKTTQRAVCLLIGIVIGVGLTLFVRSSVVRWRTSKNQDFVSALNWAYKHVPQVIGRQSGASVQILDVRLTGSTKNDGEIRLVYENEGFIKVITTRYRTANGAVVEPSDSLIRELDHASNGLDAYPNHRKP